MSQIQRRTARALAPIAATLAALALAAPPSLAADELPDFLRDRGTGVATSMFGTYVMKGEFLVYPFAEWYADSNLEYKPSEHGYGLDVDYRGRYSATEQLLFLGYGLTEDFAVELEAAYLTAELEKAPDDPSAQPEEIEQFGVGDVEGQLRWRFLREKEGRPEAFTYFETVFPLRSAQSLVGTSHWEFKWGVGLIKGYRWGTMTFRAATEYTAEEHKLEAGEYALEYLKRLSPAWRAVAVVEGNQIDEVSLITEIQWQVLPRAVLKANNGWGLTENATDFAPELGILFSF